MTTPAPLPAGAVGPAYRPDQLLGARHDGPDRTGPFMDWEPDLPPGAVEAADESLRAVLEPWLSCEVFGSTLASQIRTAAMVAVRDAAPHLVAAERERIKADGAVSACCGAKYHREPGKYGRWQCHGCGTQCDLIGVIG